jgi:hypothetical protein
MAHRERVSLNTYIADAVRARVAGEHVGSRFLSEVRQLFAKTQTAAASVMTVGNRQDKYTEPTQTTLREKTSKGKHAGSSRSFDNRQARYHPNKTSK